MRGLALTGEVTPLYRGLSFRTRVHAVRQAIRKIREQYPEAESYVRMAPQKVKLNRGAGELFRVTPERAKFVPLGAGAISRMRKAAELYRKKLVPAAHVFESAAQVRRYA